MTINVHIFERSEALQECVEHLILWGRRDTELAHRMNYRTFVQPAAPFIDAGIQVSELSPGVVEVSFYDGRLPEDTRYSAKGLAMYAKLEELPGDRTRIHLSCAIDEFIPHWEQLLADFEQTLSPESGPDVPGVAGQGAEGDELPIPEGKTRYSPEDWAAIFLWTSKRGVRPDYYQIAQLTGKKYSTVKNAYSEWRSREGDEMSPGK